MNEPAIKTLDTEALLNDILSSPSYKNLNKEALRQQYDSSPHILNAIKSASEAAAIPTPLTTPTFSSIPENGWLINEPGTYTMTGDCAWTPKSPGAAITILADNVVLDLGGFVLSVQVPAGSGTEKFNGVNVALSSNVTVQNGTISGANYYGLQATFADTVNLFALNVTSLSYKDKITQNATPCGIFMGGCGNIQILDCSVSNIDVLAASCAGIQLIACQQGTVSNCGISQLKNQDGGAQGFSYLLCKDIRTTRGSCDDFVTDYQGLTITSGHTSIGFIPILSKKLHFDGCSSTNIKGCCDDAHGMSLFLVKEIIVNNFKAHGVTDGPAPYNTGAKATGLEVYGDNITVNNSQVDNIHATMPQDLQAAGFSAWGDAITFNNCSADDVQVLNASGQPDTKLGYGTGYGWAPDPRTLFKHTMADNVQYNSCSSTNCQLGCDTWNHTNSIWTVFSAVNCGQCCLNLPAGATREFTMNQCSEKPSDEPSPVIITNHAANNSVPEC